MPRPTLDDATFDKHQERIKALVDKWRTPLGLNWWKLHIVYDTMYKQGDDKRECAADCRASWQYMEATITFYMPTVIDLDDDELEYIFVHECMHILVREMRRQDEHENHNIDHEERVCTTLAKAFQWVRAAGVEEGQRKGKERKRK